jgi:hypothetical protein
MYIRFIENFNLYNIIKQIEVINNNTNFIPL